MLCSELMLLKECENGFASHPFQGKKTTSGSSPAAPGRLQIELGIYLSLFLSHICQEGSGDTW